MKRCFGLLSTIFLCVFLNLSCNPTTASIGGAEQFYKFEVSETDFDLGDRDEFEFVNIFGTSDGDGRLIVHYKKTRRSDGKNLGYFFRFSADGGKKFGKEYKVAETIKSDFKINHFVILFIPNGFAVTITEGHNFYYSQSIGGLENWTEPVQVNDEQDSVYSGIRLLQTSENEIYLIWNDKRRGFSLIFFSSSNDGGKTWSANQAIDYDFREGNQEHGRIVLGENGRLHAIWQDWRDRKTLVDIRHSYSDDKGISWSKSVKINDDEQEVWQYIPTVVAYESNIYVAFSDFREKGLEDDNDWNIYFASSTDNGTTWEKNKRLNKAKAGIDGLPKLSIDKRGNIYCAWESGRHTLFGQIVFSYSNDKGESWSEPIFITGKEELAIGDYTYLINIDSESLLLRIGLEKSGRDEFSNLYLKKTDKVINSEIEKETDKQIESGDPIKYKIGETLFEDDFSNNSADKWIEESGIWDIVGGTYMGVFPNQGKPFISYAKFPEPEEYILEGRFRLDSVSHTAAIIYFRVNSEDEKYVIVNRFRNGAWLSLRDGDIPVGRHLAIGTPLVQKQYPFRQDRWYEFTLVVTPEQIDYYVDDLLMLSYKGELKFPKGKFGIGGFMPSPTYFDDIKLSELK